MTESPGPLREEDLNPDPMRQFEIWFEQATAAEIPLAEAAALATSSADGVPSLRMVLVKEWDQLGFVFYTHHESRKGRDLEANPRAALLFHWQSLGRQVRIEGTASRVAQQQSDRYFASRPRGAQLGAIASRQSQPIGSREELDQLVAKLEVEFGGRPLARPSGWGGYRISPSEFEFWQQGEHRLHDRVRYLPAASGWVRQRLQP